MPVGPSRLGEQRFPGADGVARPPADLDPRLQARLTRIYGSRQTASSSSPPEICPPTPLGDAPAGLPAPADGQPVAAEVLLAVRDEEALHLADVLARRTMAGLHSDLGRSVAEATARIMASELGWSKEDIAAEHAAYEAYLRRFEPPWQPVAAE